MVFSKTQRIVFCALFTALSTVATMVIQIPSPMQGYVNLGDVFVLFGSLVLGPIYGTISAGLGSALADILTGYVIYAPATALIKSAMSFCSYYLFVALKKAINNETVSVVISGIVAELIMVVGYFLYACLIMGEGLPAIASVPGNLVQGAFGVTIATALYVVFIKTNVIKPIE
jgi:uncharacterized membrane protein